MEYFTKGGKVSDALMDKLNKEKETALGFQKRRHEEWTDNYQLYRNKVNTNRLTQRQAVTIPLMKETLKTILSKIDDPPTITFKDKDGEEADKFFKDLRSIHNPKRCGILDAYVAYL
mgnify:CR=1 FL=1